MRHIKLTRGLFAMVDDEDYEMLSHYKWMACKKGSGFYAARNSEIGGRHTTIRMHRQILLPDPDKEVDHINGDQLDNRRCNLRPCTRTQNRHNTRSAAGSTSKFVGVYWDSQRKAWRARVTVDGKRVHVGLFQDETEAAKARDIAATEAYGEWAWLNFR